MYMTEQRKKAVRYFCFNPGEDTTGLMYYVEPPKSIKESMDVIEVKIEDIEDKREGFERVIKRDENDQVYFEFKEIPEPEEEDKNMVELTPELLELLEEFRLSREGK